MTPQRDPDTRRRLWFRGTAIVAGALLVLPSCKSGVRLGTAPTTTTTIATTTSAPARTTTTARRVRKATTSTTASASPTPAAPESEPEAELEAEAEGVRVGPAQLEPFLLQPGAGWHQLPDDMFDTGPSEIDDAAVDEAGPENAAESRRFLEALDFHSGLSRAWADRPLTYEAGERTGDYETLVIASMYFFGSPEGASKYLEHSVDTFDEATDLDDVTPFTVGDIPGSRSWAGGNDDDGYTAIVTFAAENFYVQVYCTRWTKSQYAHRTRAAEFAREQFTFRQGDRQ